MYRDNDTEMFPAQLVAWLYLLEWIRLATTHVLQDILAVFYRYGSLSSINWLPSLMVLWGLFRVKTLVDWWVI